MRPEFGRSVVAIDKLTAMLPERRYYASANTLINLSGEALDLVYVAYADLKANV